MRARLSLSRRSTAGFTLTELLIATFLSTIVVGAVASLSIAALRTYYVESDYVEIGGQSRRLIDDLTEQGTFADDLAVFRDIDASHRIAVSPGDRGDCLMLFERSTNGTGNITSFVCYYLAYTSSTGSGARPISLWRFTGALASGGTPTPFPTIALNNYPRSAAKRVSGDIFTGTLPRPMPAVTIPITPRPGIFTNDGFVSGGSPTVLVNLPSRLTGRGNSTNKATSNITFAISPRR
jgi:Prokaryotic N-terminal methylation motif